MFIGHDAVAFAAKNSVRRTSLGTLMMAANWLDLIWPLFLILGIEHVRVRGGSNPFLILDFYDYPWTHSLVMSIVWSIAFGAVYWIVTRYTRGAIVTGVLVFSHWVLDFVTHIPDLPLTPHGQTVGLGLWKSVTATLIVESALFVAGVFVYVRTTRPRDRIGTWALVGLIAFLIFVYAASVLGPPPPDVKPIGYVGMAAWLFPLWGWWIDRHREARA
jgi:hypothetical protein